MRGKAYANRKSVDNRPRGDFYSTPRSLVWVARDVILNEFDMSVPILEPCSGRGAISDELKKMGFPVYTNDLYNPGGQDYLTTPFKHRSVITNPPFSLWDSFVIKAKGEADKVMMIGRLNYLGTNSRLVNGLWEDLKSIYCFDRYIDYRTPIRDDGHFHVGAMATAWFLWERNYDDDPTIHVLSVQEYATLGNVKEEDK